VVVLGSIRNTPRPLTKGWVLDRPSPHALTRMNEIRTSQARSAGIGSRKIAFHTGSKILKSEGQNRDSHHGKWRRVTQETP
jgi:hypothetical protein